MGREVIPKGQRLIITNKPTTKGESLAAEVKRFNLRNKFTKNLSREDFKFLKQQQPAQEQIQIVGPRRSTFNEVIKRFLKNKVAVFSTISLFFIIIFSIIVFFTSTNDPIKQIAYKEDIQTDFTSNLPSSLFPVVTRVYDYYSNSNIINAIEIAAKQDPTFHFTFKVIPDSSSVIYTYDSFHMLKAITGVKYWSLFGTNGVGQDVWTRTWFGVLEAVSLGILITFTEALIGIFLGSYIGFHAGKLLDTICMRVIDVITSIPGLLWLVMFSSWFGTSFFTLYFINVFFGWTGSVASTRSYIILIKDREFVRSSQAVGSTKLRQVFLHCLPAMFGKILYGQILKIPNVIFFVASLSFLNLIQDSNTYNLGVIINKARGDFRFNHWVLTLPVILLLTITLSLKFFAIGLHDALEPPRLDGSGKRR